MTKSLKETIVFVLIMPLVACGLMLLAGAGVFSFLLAYLLSAIAERVVKHRKAQAVIQAQPQRQQGLDLVAMDVAMKFRDKSVDLRVVN